MRSGTARISAWLPDRVIQTLGQSLAGELQCVDKVAFTRPVWADENGQPAEFDSTLTNTFVVSKKNL
jgi:hypothetical protein